MKILVVAGLIVLLTGCAEDLNSELIMKKVESSKPNELKLVIKQGMDQSEKLDSYSLILLSMASLKNGDNLSTELFLYQALLRAGVDREVYVPTETGGNSPTLALMALRQQISSALSYAEQKTPEQYQYLIDSLKNWKPICENQYNPGWVYEVIPDLQLCQSKFKELIEKNVSSMIQKKVLYEHSEYFTLLKKWQDLQMKLMFSQSTEPDEELINLQNKLIDIEKELGVKGEVTKYNVVTSSKPKLPILTGAWKLYKDDDKPNKETPHEIINFREDGEFCLEGSYSYTGKYEIKSNLLSLEVTIKDKSVTYNREFNLKNNVIKLKNEKIGWAYYKRINKTPMESCF